ncbi:MAG: peroxidase [Planctomycetota bacterium]|nr:peroxidase [Planctomycetota bacterium]
MVHALASDWRSANLSEANRVLCAFATKLTREPDSMRAADLDDLRRVGFEDRAIHDATQIVGYFNYVTRVADALGIEPETFIPPWGGDAHLHGR